MSTTPRVTVVVATYNCERFIGDALRSVQAQTLREWECIVVDDASTDNTHAVVKTFTDRDERFRYLRMERNSGVAAARNRGIAEARAQLLQFLDADDVLAPLKLERHTAFMDDHPEVALVYSDYRHFIDVVEPTGAGGYLEDEKLSGKGNAVLHRLIKGNVLRMNTLLLRTDVVRELGGFHPPFRHIEDWDLWLRMAATRRRFHFLDDPACVVGVRDSPGSLSKDRSRMRRNVLPVFQHIWGMPGLSFMSRCLIIIRYIDVLLEQLIVHRDPASFAPAKKGFLHYLSAACAVLVLPLWLLARPFR